MNKKYAKQEKFAGFSTVLDDKKTFNFSGEKFYVHKYEADSFGSKTLPESEFILPCQTIPGTYIT